MIGDRLGPPLGRRLAARLFRPPRRPHHRRPADFGLEAETGTVRTADGIELHVWFIPGRGAGTAIVGHGIGLTKSASLRQAELLHRLGYHVLLFDHRNHGRSGSDRARRELADRFSRDIAACVAAATERWPDAGPLVVWGFSFSTFPTLYALRTRASPIHAILCDSGPGLELDPMLRRFVGDGGAQLPALARSALRHPSAVAAFAATAVSMLGAVWPPDASASASGTTPMLFLVGTDDEVLDPAQVRALSARYPHARVAELPTGHLLGIKDAEPEYRAAVTTFLAELAAG
ncbi:alpha/beta hydrolase [Agromyces soli]|uniref:Alpha/beta fold hydrolase n=1 Tax=Agromyces soli TaxID=659012 RepID=A0ABY4B175_9MICO|nr:alpha/beta fold hydrolase [Agromyces soli]UOE26775.1 alpha/beta fold hydrolase [Agromyces soli]